MTVERLLEVYIFKMHLFLRVQFPSLW